MKKYIALITGRGEGCDYTIGCNLKWREVKNVSSMAEAVDKLRSIFLDTDDETDWEEYPSEYGETEGGYPKIEILEVTSSLDLDMEEISAEGERRATKARASNIEQKEREELKRLTTKYGKLSPKDKKALSQ